MKSIRYIEIDSELGAGTRGSSLGIGAIKSALLNAGSTLFTDADIHVVKTLNEKLWEPIDTPYAKRVEGIVEIFNRTKEAMVKAYSDNKFPLVLSGDHSTGGGTISGIKAAFPDKRLGVIWIDAHADLHTPYTTPSGNVHGMPLATALQVDNKKFQRNSPSEKSVELWEALKSCGTGGEKLKPEDLLFIAVRDTEKEEDGLMEEFNIKNITVEDVQSNGVESTIQQSLDYLRACDIIYISFDVDSMDCDLVSNGTGTPVSNGLTPFEAEDLINGLVSNPKTVCFEMVEVNPCLDEKMNKMAETAAIILESLVNKLK